MSLAELLRPGHTAVVTQECQRGAIGDGAVWPALAEAAAPMRPRVAALADAARSAGVQVVHCISAKRDDLAGSNANAPLFVPARRSSRLRLDTSDAELVDELAGHENDLALVRTHGTSPLNATGLDAILRNLGVRTIVVAGVSVNVAITAFVMDAVNASYDVVLPRDAVAGVPADYADAVIDNTLALLATVTTTDDITGAWV